MIIPDTPVNEKERLQALHELEILDTESEETFDNIVELAASVCNVPVSLITLVDDDRQWFKSKIGTKLCDSERNKAYCSHAILKPHELTVVEDATTDERFSENPLALDSGNRIKFYAGMPILNSDGLPLGTLCVIDEEPRSISSSQRKMLKKLAKQVEVLIDLRNKNALLENVKDDLNDHNRVLKDFAGLVSHDLKMPLANMVLTADILKKRLSPKLDQQDIDHLDYLKNSGLRLSDYITDVLNYYDSGKLLYETSEEFDIHELLEHIIDLLNLTQDCVINLPEENQSIICNRAALTQIYINLLSNSFKYNDKERIQIDLGYRESATHYIFYVKDNGIGIPQDRQTEIFNLFSTLDQGDRYGKSGNGIGLSTVKKIVQRLGGKITVDSKEGEGATFTFTVKK
ncbi:sensor histidine kinase [Christiangramia salexigens]|uniref:histidine kinase n=1 Tax=Christiangramia salexigens TaxID=1913577 RepID=A0A1L3J8C3_9FLAO|nr:GAF domain-containing sensor histidine kinase [Christiangramia salexigens]APG61377.1 ATPase [Christiangramia salexigens]